MAKKKKVDTAAGDALTHSPFAALAGLEAPPGPPREPPSAPAPEAEAAAARFAPKVVVRRERKGRGGKTVTRVEGVAAVAREELADRLKRALGCGASLEDGHVVLHGDVADRAVAWLEADGAPHVVRGS